MSHNTKLHVFNFTHIKSLWYVIGIRKNIQLFFELKRISPRFSISNLRCLTRLHESLLQITRCQLLKFLQCSDILNFIHLLLAQLSLIHHLSLTTMSLLLLIHSESTLRLIPTWRKWFIKPRINPPSWVPSSMTNVWVYSRLVLGVIRIKRSAIITPHLFIINKNSTYFYQLYFLIINIIDSTLLTPLFSHIY